MTKTKKLLKSLRMSENCSNFASEIAKAERQLTEFPDSGTPLKTRRHHDLGLKFVFISKLSKMIYHVDGEQVVIDVIWDTRQSPRRLANRLVKI